MKDKPLVSIIVPVYNTQDYLVKCVDSILAQTYHLIEVILVDDGSTDDSGRICDTYAEQDNRVEVLHKSNGGLMSAWMAGVGISHGEYLAFIDSDDWIEAEMIAELVSHLDSEDNTGDGSAVSGFIDTENRSSVLSPPATIICCNHLIEHTSGRQTPVRHGAVPGVYTGEKLHREIFCKILGNEIRTIAMSRCMKLIARNLILENMQYCDPSISMGEDVNIMLPVILDSERIVVLKDAFYYHYLYNDDSIVHSYDAGLNDNMHRLNDAIHRILTEKFSGPKLRKAPIDNAGIEALAARERLLLFMLQLKNELRNPAEKVTERIRTLCTTEKIPELALKYPLNVTGSAEKLLYAIEKKPTAFNIHLAQMLYHLRH